MRPLRSFFILFLFLAGIILAFDIFPFRELIHRKPAQEVSSDTILVSAAEAEPPVTDPLSVFIDSLQHSTSQVRIIYYGDSQVEGDRITFYLRQLLRETRNGTGPGLFLPVMPVMYTKTLWIRASDNWKRYNYLSYKAGDLRHPDLGPFMAVCRFLPDDSVAPAPVKAMVRIRPSDLADSSSAHFDRLRIFYSLPQGKVNIVVRNDKILLSDTLDTCFTVSEISCYLNGADDVVIEFAGRVSPVIYGISIESATGIIVDNIPQRGSAGLEFSMVGKDNLAEVYRILSPDLIILHYGLNIVRNVRDDYSYYQRGVSRQINVLKEVAPLTPVLVVGVTDMAEGKGDTARSFSNIPSIIKAQKEAAITSGAAFWDSYAAMGGSRSIVKWAGKTPALAQNDYVHFTYPGADTIARLMYRALFHDGEDTSGSVSFAPAPPTAAVIDKPSNEENKLISALKYNPARPFIFTSPAFWLFLLVVVAGYSLVYKKLFVRNLYLLAVSLFFYYETGGLFLFLLLFITVIDYSCGLLIFRSKRRFSRWLFIFISLVSNLGILAYFKYTGFIVETVNSLAGTSFETYDFLASFSNGILGTSFNVSEIILPAGISFFTFQSLSYTLDIYRGKLDPVRNIFDFGFYVSFFPQLVAGPIVRASEFIPQLYTPFSLNKREFSHALFVVSRGLIKKIVISDFIAVNLVDRVFGMPSAYSGFENLMAVYGYGLQIYCDFSGYTDIAIGIALVLGFRLPVNFNSPYKAAGISDFWKRWHISLSRWLKDYLYISLGGNRKGKIRTGINLMITMLLGGLWHGANLRFVIWGALHGAGLVFSKIWSSITGNRFAENRPARIISIFLTFNFVSFAWIFFRAGDLQSAIIMLKQIFGNFSPGSYLTVAAGYTNVLLLMAAGYLIHYLPESIKESYRGLFIKIPLVLQLVIVALVAVLLIMMRSADAMPFIYFRF